MVFTNPYFLIALVTAGIPFILHLITKKRIKTVKFPSLIFIKQALEKESRKIKLKELLLLIIRTLIIILLVLSSAKPIIQHDSISSAIASSENEKSIVIILDNSFSMGVISQGESLFKQAKRIVLRILKENIRTHDNISIILSADVDRVKFYDLTYDKSEIEDIIENAKISFVNNNIFESLIDAKKILDNSRNSQKMIYLISDIQKINFIQNENYIYPYLQIDYPIFMVKINAKDKKNSAVIKNKIPLKLNFRNDNISLYPVVQNFSGVKNNLIIKTGIDNQAVHQKSITLDPFEKQTVDTHYMVNKSGFLSGRTEIVDGDDLIADNKNYFVLHIPENISLSIFDANNELFYILNAINPSYVLNKQAKGYIKIKEYPRISPKHYQDVMILNYDSITSTELKYFRSILKNSSVLLFPGKQLDINNFNSLFSKSGLVEGLILQKNMNKNSPFSIEFIDLSHPLFDIFKDIPLFQNTKFFSYYKIKLDNLSYDTRILAKFNNGDPAVIEYQVVSGMEEQKRKILLFTFLPDADSTDFVYNPNFPPFIQQAIKYLVNRPEEEYYNTFFTGQSIDDVFSILNPKNKKIEQVLGDDKESIKDNVFIHPGVYRVDKQYISVNVDYTESDLSEIPVKSIKENYSGLKIYSAETKKEINEKLFHSSGAKSIWKTLLVIAFLLLVLELIIAHDLWLKVLPLFNILRMKIVQLKTK